jgi:hypothetical protein
MVDETKSSISCPINFNAGSLKNCQNFKDFKVKSKNSPLCIFHQNIRGLKGKVDELIEFISTGLPHTLCISEHHLNSTDY